VHDAGGRAATGFLCLENAGKVTATKNHSLAPLPPASLLPYLSFLPQWVAISFLPSFHRPEANRSCYSLFTLQQSTVATCGTIHQISNTALTAHCSSQANMPYTYISFCLTACSAVLAVWLLRRLLQWQLERNQDDAGEQGADNAREQTRGDRHNRLVQELMDRRAAIFAIYDGWADYRPPVMMEDALRYRFDYLRQGPPTFAGPALSAGNPVPINQHENYVQPQQIEDTMMPSMLLPGPQTPSSSPRESAGTSPPDTPSSRPKPAKCCALSGTGRRCTWNVRHWIEGQGYCDRHMPKVSLWLACRHLSIC